MTIEMEIKQGKHKETSVLDEAIVRALTDVNADFPNFHIHGFLFTPISSELVIKQKLIKDEREQMIPEHPGSENRVLFQNEINKANITIVERDITYTLKWRKTKKHKKG